MNLQSNDISEWGGSLKDFAPEYSPVKCTNILQFFRMRGRTSTVTRENIEPIPELHYCLLSPAEKRYYFKLYRAWTLEQLHIFSNSAIFTEDIAVEQLKAYILDGNVWLLLNETQVAETRDTMRRIWSSKKSNPQNVDIDYKQFYPVCTQLIDEILRLEDYKVFGRNLTGFKTVCNQMTESIQALWKQASAMTK